MVDFLQNFKDSVSDLVTTFTVGFGSNSSAPTGLESDGNTKGLNIWSITGSSWASTFAYQFIVEKADGNPQPEGKKPNATATYFTLPIPPQQFSVEPVLPGQVTTTVGGIVEELSAVSLWHINMSGTMGIAVSRDSTDRNARKKMATVFRQRISTTGLLSGISAELQSTISKVGGVVNALGNGDVTGAINNTILPPIPFSGSAVDQNSNGYTETQELQKFFYMYHYLKSNHPNQYNLYFVNYKTNQRWQVQVKKYIVKQSASNPNLYRYDLALVGWNVSGTDAATQKANSADRFAKGGDLASVNTVGLNAIPALNTIGGNLAKLGKAGIPGVRA